MRTPLRWAGLAAAVCAAGCGQASPAPSTSSTASTPAPAAVTASAAAATPTPSTAPAGPSCPAQATPIAVTTPQRPGTGIPAGAPADPGLATFAVITPGVLTRSGTPNIEGFQFLRSRGWKGIVSVRTESDTDFTGFAAFGFRYQWLPVASGEAPTDEQVQTFLCFVRTPGNQPVDVHDNSGTERAGVFVAAWRYSAQGWSMDDALAEQALYGTGLYPAQVAFLRHWAATHERGVIG